MPVEVELNVFSSRQNPHWCLREEQVSELKERLAHLEELPEAKVRSRLGYRGLLVLMGPSVGSGEEVRVFRGVVERESGSFVDQNRELERWLIDTGRESIPPDLQELVRTELEG